jgi:hypothetical protein
MLIGQCQDRCVYLFQQVVHVGTVMITIKQAGGGEQPGACQP